MNTSLDIFLTCLEFTDKGIEILLSQNIPYLKDFELKNIGNYYTIIFGNSCFDHGLLFGPLPVAYHHDQLVFLYGNTIKDESLTDPRVVRDDHLTPFFVLVFFPVGFDQLFSRCRVSIRATIDEWLYDKREVKAITHECLNGLKVRLTEVVLREQALMENSQTQRSLPTALTKNIEFLNTIGHSLGRSLRVGVFGSAQCIFPILQSAVAQNFLSLCSMNTSTSGKTVVYRFPNLFIEAGTLEVNEVLDFKQTAALTNINPWNNYPKEFDGILLVIKIPNSKEVIIKNIQTILQKTPNRCPISLFICYDSNYSREIASTPIPEVISEASDRTISLLESKKGYDMVETALIDLVEKIIPFLAN
ncbi:MAG: hypothetical protein ACFFBD_15740 [Candidatus Hodarchaeota archaeon]